MTKRTEAINNCANMYAIALNNLWQKLPVDECGEPMPAAEIAPYIASMITADRDGRVRMLTKHRKRATDAERVMFERMEWHCRGAASMWGPMISTMRVDRDTWNRLDTLAALLGHVQGRKSASDRWARALGGK